MDIRKIKKLIELLEESGIAEIEIKEGEESLRIARASPTTMVTHAYPASYAPPAAAVGSEPPMMAAPVTAAAAPTRATGAAPVAQPDEHVVTAPMVGTYYASSAPGAKQFVDLGEEVKVGQVLCIIEAMKMMNQIESDKAGRIKAILVQNSEPVEFGQPLFIIE